MLCAVITCWAAASAQAGTFTNPAFESVTLAGGLDFPTTVTWAPDGRMFIAEKFGYVRVLEPDGTLLPTPIVDIHDHVVNSGDRGLLGLAAAPVPNSSDVYLYLLYTKRAANETDNQAADTTLSADSTLTRVTVHANNSVVGGSADPTETVILGHASTTPASTTSDTANGCPDVTTDCIPSEGYTHTIGTVIVYPHDGSLWVSTGDGYSDGAYTDLASAPFHLRAQDPQSLAGKILHVHADGTGFTGSPYCAGISGATTQSNCSKVWAAGFRNPFRFTLRKLGNGTYQPIGGDVGEGNWEELNDMTRGYNGGWPCWEGPHQADEVQYAQSASCQALGSAYNHAFYLFDHYEGTTTDFGGAVVGGPVYSGSTYPASFKGQEFSTDYVHGWIRYHALSSSDPQANFHTFLSGENGGLGSGPTTPLVSLVQAPDGNLVDTEIYGDSANPGPGTGSVNEIRYSPTDKAPLAQATASASCVDTNTTTTPTVQFSGDGSADPDGDKALTYTWYFGDGATDSGTGLAHADPSHTYPNTGGAYLVRLKVTDSKGNSNNAFLTLHIGPGFSPPEAHIVSPSPSTANPGPDDPSPDQYIAGEQIHLSGGTTSGAGSEMSWLPVLVHGGTHTHVLGSIPTPSGDVPDAANGVPAFVADAFHGADSYYIVYFTVTRNGCSTTKSEVIHPQVGPYKMDAFDQSDGNAPIPAPVSFLHTSIPDTAPAPHSFTVAKNAIATASAPRTWVNGGWTYTFNHWVLHNSSGDTIPSPASNDQEIQPYNPDLTDTSIEGASAYFTRSDQAPRAAIAPLPDGPVFMSGHPLSLTSASLDPEDGRLAGASLQWTVKRTVNGVSTLSPPTTGSRLTFTPDAGGDPGASYTVILTATDSHGKTNTTALTLRVATGAVTVTSQPRGIGLSAGSTRKNSPFVVGPLLAGTTLTVSAPAQTTLGRVRYRFVGWSNQGSRSQALAVPIGNVTLQALFAGPLHLFLPDSKLRRTSTLAGTLSDSAGRPAHLQLALRPAHMRGRGCVWWSANRHGLLHTRAGCNHVSWLKAATSVRGGVVRWTLPLRGRLTPGAYRLLARAQYGSVLVASPGPGVALTVRR